MTDTEDALNAELDRAPLNFAARYALADLLRRAGDDRGWAYLALTLFRCAPGIRYAWFDRRFDLPGVPPYGAPGGTWYFRHGDAHTVAHCGVHVPWWPYDMHAFASRRDAEEAVVAEFVALPAWLRAQRLDAAHRADRGLAEVEALYRRRHMTFLIPNPRGH